MTLTVARDTSTLQRFWPWFGLLARVVVGGVWLIAGWTKVTDPAASIRAVRAYELLPEAVVPTVGNGLPVLELSIGLLLVVGLAQRLSAMVSALLLLGFTVGIASAWTRGLQIECGCFGGGGAGDADAASSYPWDIARDVGLLALSVALAWRPLTGWSIDGVISSAARPKPEPDMTRSHPA